MKTAWILPGGGSHSAYTAGALLAVHQLGLPDPNIAIASSGSSGTMAYYLAGQYSSIRRIWCNLLSTKKFGNPLRIWKLMDVNYLVDQVVKIQEPLNVEIIKKSHTIFLIPMTEDKSGEIKYFSINEGIDFFELLRASNSAPFFSGIFKKNKPINKNEVFFDSRISSRPEQNIKKAISLSADRIIVFDNYHPKSSWTNGLFWYNIWLYTRSSIFRNYHKKLLSEQYNQDKNVEIIYLKPQKPLNLAVWNNNRSKLENAFNQGYNETMIKRTPASLYIV